ncbi:MAG TPA: hypothetical protein VGO80_00965 [Solirubrobacteraceae bacterium]|nr:hypothetical protein [Solirubrobacteraceae bacterium]
MSPADRARQVRRLLRSEGASGVATRVLTRALNRVSPAGYGSVPVSREDLQAAGEIAAGGWKTAAVLPALPGEPLTIAWVMVPPGEGSGGHTTMFRMIAALERAGHTCVVYLHDRHGWALDQHVERIRRLWPWVGAEIRSAAAGIEDSHGVFATAWQTAYPVLASPAKGRRFYFVQDFEPSFYPAGSLALLAEATYGFGFHGVTAGRWLAELLPREYGMPADHFDFGCDLERYVLDEAVERTGVCYYCRPTTPRRAYELAVVTLDLFSQRHPLVPIHFFGEPSGKLPFAATDHGLLSPGGLNDLYNRCVAGLTLSATNVSLVPHEMLAAGCVPVVNDADHNRVVLANDHVAYAPATPFDLASALSRIVEQPPQARQERARAAAASVSSTTWEHAGTMVDAIVRRVVLEAVGDREIAA